MTTDPRSQEAAKSVSDEFDFTLKDRCYVNKVSQTGSSIADVLYYVTDAQKNVVLQTT